jgi:hypothetical protein
LIRGVLALVLLAGCYSPNVKDGQFTCKTSSACPADFDCICNLCRAPGVDAGACNPGDGGQPQPDMRMNPVRTDGCSLPLPGGGSGRGSPDPGLERLAFCPAAWRVPGLISTAGRMTPCNRQPRGDGRSMTGTDCSAEDNCAPGWHLCLNETEIMMAGLTRALCDEITIGTAEDFYATGQTAGPTSPGAPPSCNVPQDRAIMGCGKYGKPVPSGCMVLTRAIIDDPMPDDGCTTINAAWACSGTGGTGGELNTVVKASGMGGGVMCCKN